MISILEFPLRTSNFISNLCLFPPHRYSESAPIRTKAGMAEDSTKDVKESTTSTDTEIEKAKKKKGLLSRLWGAISRLHGDNFEKRLQYISKEETAILSRISRRSNNWRRITKQLISFSVLLEAIAIGYAIMTTRTLDLNWKIRALRLLPMFLLPVLLSITYFTFRGFIRMLDQKDHKTLEKLRAERQAKIDELKEKTNYYITQQLIQKYDTDPAAKAAAATVLASKLGADSGLKVYLGDDPNQNVAIGKSKEMEVSRTDGLRNRKPSSSMQNASTRQGEEEMHNQVGLESTTTSPKRHVVVDHHPQPSSSSIHDGGWIARFAALLVGEDPTQSYALICGNCYRHNGLARKEEFPYVCYYCPHCHALNRGKQSERVSSSNSPSRASSVVEEGDVAQICDELIAASSPLAVGDDAASGSQT